VVWVFLNGVSTTVCIAQNAREGGFPLGNGIRCLGGGLGFDWVEL
jgi:hypothetical protein